MLSSPSNGGGEDWTSLPCPFLVDSLFRTHQGSESEFAETKLLNLTKTGIAECRLWTHERSMAIRCSETNCAIVNDNWSCIFNKWYRSNSNWGLVHTMVINLCLHYTASDWRWKLIWWNVPPYKTFRLLRNLAGRMLLCTEKYFSVGVCHMKSEVVHPRYFF